MPSEEALSPWASFGRSGLRAGPIAGDTQPLTYSVAAACELLGAPSKRWVVDQIRAGRFPARKFGRTWRLTDQDIAEALEVCGNTVRPVADLADHAPVLTPTSSGRSGREQ